LLPVFNEKNSVGVFHSESIQGGTQMRKSKLIPFLLATIMIISLIQITAFAANGEPDMIQLENKTGRSYSIKDGTIKLFCPYEGYEGTETVHSGTT